MSGQLLTDMKSVTQERHRLKPVLLNLGFFVWRDDFWDRAKKYVDGIGVLSWKRGCGGRNLSKVSSPATSRVG
jgi:hypothetical protein